MTEPAVVNDLHFVIAIGINIYPGAGMSQLRFARHDACAFVKWARRDAGVPANNVRLLTATATDAKAWRDNPWESAPARRHFNQALQEFNQLAIAEEGHWERTRLYVFVAGHGYAASETTALIMADAAENMWGESLALEPYANWLHACEHYREVVVLADCCRVNDPKAAEPPPVPFNRCDRRKRGADRMLAFATREGAVAGATFDADPDAGRGHFTKLLLAGLRGAAPDRGAYGAVTATSLEQYLREKLPARTDHRQRAEVNSTGGIVFRAPAPAPEYPVHVRFSSGYRGPVTLHNGVFAEIARWDTRGGPWCRSLPDGLYELRWNKTRHNVRVMGEPVELEL